MAARLKDIAESLGVSIVTVSKALADHPDIAKATRARILDRVKELNYRPNLMARSLVTGRSSLIGLVVPDLVHPFFSEIAKALVAALRERNFFLIVASSEGDPALERAEIEHMLAHRLDALVVASCQPDAESLKKLSQGDPPLVLLDRQFAGFACNFVGTDDYKIGFAATEHLIGLGRKRVVHIRGPENNVGEKRLKGYHEAIAKHGLPASPEYIITDTGPADTDGLARGRNAMLQMLNMKPRPDGVFCFNDLIAVGVMDSALESGVPIPKDLAVIGCGNYPYNTSLRIPLASMDQSVQELGTRTARMIFDLLDAGRPTRIRKVILKPTVVARASAIAPQ